MPSNIGKTFDVEKCLSQAEEMLKKRYSLSLAKVDDLEFEKKREVVMHNLMFKPSMQKRLPKFKQEYLLWRTKWPVQGKPSAFQMKKLPLFPLMN